MVDLSIILPVYNKEEVIERFIKRVYAVMNRQTHAFEVIGVDSDSTDNSLLLLQSLAKKYSHLTVIRSKRGWGNAIRKALAVAQGKYICYMGADVSIDPLIIPSLFDKLLKSGTTLVKANRITRENIFPLATSRLYNFLIWILFGLPRHDINATPKIIDIKTLTNLNIQSVNDGYDLELLLKLRAKKLTWLEIAVHCEKHNGKLASTDILSVVEAIGFIIRFRLSKY